MSLFNAPIEVHLQALGIIFVGGLITLTIGLIIFTIIQVYDNKRDIKELQEK